MMATVLSCSMTLVAPQTALANTNLLFNISLEEKKAAEMATGTAPMSYVSFADQPMPVRQWVIHNGSRTDAPELMLGRVVTTDDEDRPLLLSWGHATRLADGSSFAFEEKMHGPCQLVDKDSLK